MMGSLRVIERYILETSALTQNSKCMWASPLKTAELIKNCSLILCWNNEIHYFPIEQKSSQIVSFNCREMQMQSNNQGVTQLSIYSEHGNNFVQSIHDELPKKAGKMYYRLEGILKLDNDFQEMFP